MLKGIVTLMITLAIYLVGTGLTYSALVAFGVIPALDSTLVRQVNENGLAAMLPAMTVGRLILCLLALYVTVIVPLEFLRVVVVKNVLEALMCVTASALRGAEYLETRPLSKNAGKAIVRRIEVLKLGRLQKVFIWPYNEVRSICNEKEVLLQ